MSRNLRSLFVSVALLAAPCLASTSVWAQGLDYVKAHYAKQEHLIPMRDGTRLFTAVFVPKDQSQRYPILLSRTPYSVQPYGADQYRSDLGPSPELARSGYIFAYQDVRGRWMSEGEFVHMRPYRPGKTGPTQFDEASDTYDTIDWLTKHLPNNGRVGMWGVSYPGFYTAAGMIDAHPALKAASPQAPVTDWFVGDDWHHNGALFLPHMFNFMNYFERQRPNPAKQFSVARFDYGTPDGYEFFLRLGPLRNAETRYCRGEVPFWTEAMQHGSYDDFWKARNVRQHLKQIRPAVMTVGGWFDAENLFGALETYRHVESLSPGASNTLVMGPWLHGGWSRSDGSSLGDVRFGSGTAVHYRTQIEFPFFEHSLKDREAATRPEAWAFETGTNQWRAYDKWPPRDVQPRSLFLGAGGRLGSPPGESGYDEYVSDPAKPVPYLESIQVGMAGDYMIADQRFAGRRPDVLVYQTGVLDTPMTIAGPIPVELFVSTSGTDSDWIVKLIDVYPDNAAEQPANSRGTRMGGYQQLVRGDVMRGKFRNSLERPEAFRPNEPTAVRFTLQDAHHTFQRGHRIMVQIQSTWFPLVDRNPQTFVDIHNAQESDFRPARQRVYRAAELASRITLPVLATAPAPARTPILRAVDLSLGGSAGVELANGTPATVKLLDLRETADPLRGAIRTAEVDVEVNGQRVTLTSGNYRLPATVGTVQIDCPVTRGCRKNANSDVWGLDADARLRLWPAGSPWQAPGTFTYPTRQRWFASMTQMANEPVYVDGGEQPRNRKIYYHYGLDIGGAEGMVDVVAATSGLVVSSGTERLPGYEDSPAKPRYDVVYLLDDQGWFYRYSHLQTIEADVRPGATVRMGQKIGVLGKEGGSGGWSHLHFDIFTRQPSGKWGVHDGYAFLWEAYLRAHSPQVVAVARPHHFIAAGARVTLDGSRSWSAAGPLEFHWTFGDGSTATGPQVERTYDRPGCYSEILRVRDSAGNTDYDFAVVQVVDASKPDALPPTIHAVYAPTFDIQPGALVTFKVRTFRSTDGSETWDFGDGTVPVRVQSDGNVRPLAKDGYAVTTHRYERPGHYIVRVQRTDGNGWTATAHLQVRVGR